MTFVSLGALLAGVVAFGVLGRAFGPVSPDRQAVATALAVDGPGAAPTAPRPTEPDQALVVTSPTHSGQEITTRRLVVTGYVVGQPVLVRISLQGRREREVDSATVAPTRSPDVTRPQRAGRFQVTFDLPNPRPNGVMVVEVALIGPDGLAFEMVRRRIQVGALDPNEEGPLGATVSGRPPGPATADVGGADPASRGAPRWWSRRPASTTGWHPG